MIIGGSGAAVSSTTSLASVEIPSRFLVKARIFSSYVVAGPLHTMLITLFLIVMIIKTYLEILSLSV